MGLFFLVYIFVGATLAGSFMVAALTMGMTTMQPVLWSSLAGFVVAIPVAWVVARKIRENV
ncbi:CTP synthetase [Sinisalibacter aestuarii]|uniref:CTP synthetase n=1 Tax=Sinisalibacter aestuarii TaxID=2949426 RepID=A0ABQ5LWX7_9RHOB|nr:CTP synthetase [Sinisalibacter aestuarii]GKY88881.1 hypothetical protein STA1M1_27500 [Sinisalibacter aestuarii]